METHGETLFDKVRCPIRVSQRREIPRGQVWDTRHLEDIAKKSLFRLGIRSCRVGINGDGKGKTTLSSAQERLRLFISSHTSTEF